MGKITTNMNTVKTTTKKNNYLDRDNKVSSILEEVLGVEGDNTSLIRLSYISKNCVNHANLNVDNKNYNFVQYFIFLVVTSMRYLCG